MASILLIDDDDSDIKRLENYLKNNFPVANVISVHLPRINGSTIIEANGETQKNKTIMALKNYWDTVDIVLVDMALLGMPDKVPASQRAINEFFNSDVKLIEQIKNHQKKLVIISGKLNLRCEISLLEEIQEYISIVNKPDKDLIGTTIEKSLCRCHNSCNIYENDIEYCERDSCLKNVIQSFIDQRR